MTPEARSVVHVLVNVPPTADAEGWRAGENRAREIAERVAAGDTTLLSIADEERKILPPRFGDQVGDLGFVHRGSLQPALDEAVFSLEVGALTEPVRTIYGFHILQVLERRPPEQLELADVREAVEDRIDREWHERRLAAFEDGLLDDADIEVSECAGSF